MSSAFNDWHSSPRRFIGKAIEVKVEGEVHRPASFSFDRENHVVKEILFYRQDYDFGKESDRHHRWWQRHHRNYYRVRTEEDKLFEIYHDRGASSEHKNYRRWYVTRQF